jgi:hypothetical protein
MIKKLYFLIFLFAFSTNTISNAQENKTVILNLKNGYSVKGIIVEQSDQVVKIKTLNGDIFEYKTEEIDNTTGIKASTSSKAFPLANKDFPKVLINGDMILNIGIGLGGKIPYGSSNKITVPPFPISFEYLVNDNLFEGKGAFGCGIFIGYSASKQPEHWTYSKVIDSRLIIGARGYMHYTLMDKLDTYSGILLGYKSDKTKYKESNNPEYSPDSKAADGGATANIFVGGRYFFNSKIAGMAELGWGVSILTLGIAAKF